MPRMTASALATLLGVSRSAVSRAFTPGTRLDPAKREMILQAARTHGYQPNVFASTLSTPNGRSRSHLVAILMGDFANPFQSWLFAELTRELQAHGKLPVLLNVDEVEALDQAILRLGSYQVDGVLAVVGSLAENCLAQCVNLELPLVLLGRSDPGGRVPSVQTDNHLAGRLAAEHLLARGARRTGFLEGRMDGEASRARGAGFAAAIQAAGLEPPCVLTAGRYSHAAGLAIWQTHAQLLTELDGLFCASDTLAMGVVDGGRHMPTLANLQIVGCDDIPQAGWPAYRLTTIAQPVQRLASEAVQRLLQRIETPATDEALAVTYLPPTLICRS